MLSLALILLVTTDEGVFNLLDEQESGGMSLRLDPEFTAAIEPLLQSLGGLPIELAAGDVEGRRILAEQMCQVMENALPDVPGISRKDHLIPVDGGASILMAEFRKVDPPRTRRAIYYIHGGGFILGGTNMQEKTIMQKAADSGVPVFSVDYRLVPEHTHLTPVNDCFAGLKWLHAHAGGLDIDPANIVVVGESAGGRLAAGLALMARDREVQPPLHKQILLFPMLDDRNTSTNPTIEDLALWKAADNKTGWDALLGEDRQNVSQYSAPARAGNLEGLPQT